MIPGFPMGLASGNFEPPAGQMYIALSASGSRTESWVVPAGVSSISIVAVGTGASGGGALAYANAIPVTSGETLTAEKVEGGTGFYGLRRGTTWLCKAANANGGTGGSAIDCVGDVANSGGNATSYGGGGAAGYSGDGGSGGTLGGNGVGGSGGGGGGGASDAGGTVGAGGGVGVDGEGASGAGGIYDGFPSSAINGGDGSGGIAGSLGGGGGDLRDAGRGGIRIIWGPGRSYPNNAEGV